MNNRFKLLILAYGLCLFVITFFGDVAVNALTFFFGSIAFVWIWSIILINPNEEEEIFIERVKSMFN